MKWQSRKIQGKWDCKVVIHKTSGIAKQQNTKQTGLQNSKAQNKRDCKVVILGASEAEKPCQPCHTLPTWASLDGAQK